MSKEGEQSCERRNRRGRRDPWMLEGKGREGCMDSEEMEIASESAKLPGNAACIRDNNAKSNHVTVSTAL